MYVCTHVCGYHSHQEVYLSEHGLEEVRVPEPLRDFCTQTEGAVIVPQHMQIVRLSQHNAEGRGKGEREGREEEEGGSGRGERERKGERKGKGRKKEKEGTMARKKN